MTLGTLLFSGCIVPQDDHVLEELPLKKNRPVRIIPERITPRGPDTRVGTDQNCGEYTFSVAVEDPDVNDILRWAFFVDYAANPKKEVDNFIVPTNAVVRPTLVTATFNSAGSSRLFSAGSHVLEVVVADTDFGNDRIQAPHGQTSDGGEDQGFSDTYSWFVDAVPGACP